MKKLMSRPKPCRARNGKRFDVVPLLVDWPEDEGLGTSDFSIEAIYIIREDGWPTPEEMQVICPSCGEVFPVTYNDLVYVYEREVKVYGKDCTPKGCLRPEADWPWLIPCC